MRIAIGTAKYGLFSACAYYAVLYFTPSQRLAFVGSFALLMVFVALDILHEEAYS